MARVTCPKCNARLRVPDTRLEGRSARRPVRLRCPGCGLVFTAASADARRSRRRIRTAAVGAVVLAGAALLGYAIYLATRPPTAAPPPGATRPAGPVASRPAPRP